MSEPNQLAPNKKFIVFGMPLIEDEEVAEVVAAMRSGWIGTGPRVAQFESEFAAYKGVSHAMAVNSCTAALHLSALAAGIAPGDEVITTPMTFCATVNAIVHAGATPVLADIDPGTMNIDPTEVSRHITSRTRAIIPVHFGGRPCDMDALMTLARQHDLKVIEDCAHAVEAEYKGKKIGTLGDFGCFSFYVTKNVVTGEGGMVLAKNNEQAAQIKVLGLHGMDKDAWKRFGDDGYKHYEVVACGFKYNMMDLQAALGIHQLRRVEKCWFRRKQIWDRYMTELADLPIDLPVALEVNTRHSYHLFTFQIEKSRCGITRDEFIAGMTANNIGVGVHYRSVPEHIFYQTRFGWQPDEYPNAKKIGRTTVSVPLSAALTDDNVTDIIFTIRKLLKVASCI